MTRIHWLGIGLSSVPGIKRLASLHEGFVLWCRRVDAGSTLLANCRTRDVRHLGWEELAATVTAGDVVVSMLPASEHQKVAAICLDREAHFVSSSYVSEEMQALHEPARARGLR